MMRNFFALVGFEYKKSLSRKSAIITIVVALFFVFITQISNLFSPGAFEDIESNRTYARSQTGRILDAELFMEAFIAYTNSDNNTVPYMEVLRFPYGITAGSTLTENELLNFYDALYDAINQNIKFFATQGFLSPNGEEQLRQLYVQAFERNPRPWTFEYTGGNRTFLRNQLLVSMILFFV